MISCFYCGKRLSKTGKPSRRPTKDHVLPTCRGGANTRDNRVLSCVACNGDKAGFTLEEYRLVVAFRKGIIKPCRKFVFPGEQNL